MKHRRRDKILILIGCIATTILFVVTTTGEEWIKHQPARKYPASTSTHYQIRNDNRTSNNNKINENFVNKMIANRKNENTTRNKNLNTTENNNNNNILNNYVNKYEKKQNRRSPSSVVDYYGIWRFCFKNGHCLEIVEAWRYTKWFNCPNWLQAVRIFACTATGLEAFALLNIIAALLPPGWWGNKNNTNTVRESKYTMVAAPCLMMIALAVYTAYERPVHRDYVWGWTFILGWTSVTSSLVYSAVVLFVIARWKEKKKQAKEHDVVPIETPMMSYDLE